MNNASFPNAVTGDLLLMKASRVGGASRPFPIRLILWNPQMVRGAHPTGLEMWENKDFHKIKPLV
ncbi:MAG TPA: hypothetical protein VIF37_02390 [Methylobacter sp.]|jgi:hypothetical protein